MPRDSPPRRPEPRPLRPSDASPPRISGSRPVSRASSRSPPPSRGGPSSRSYRRSPSRSPPPRRYDDAPRHVRDRPRPAPYYLDDARDQPRRDDYDGRERRDDYDGRARRDWDDDRARRDSRYDARYDARSESRDRDVRDRDVRDRDVRDRDVRDRDVRDRDDPRWERPRPAYRGDRSRDYDADLDRPRRDRDYDRPRPRDREWAHERETSRPWRDAQDDPVRRVSLEPPAVPAVPERPVLSVPVRVRTYSRPGARARAARRPPPPLPEREFQGCSSLEAYELTVKLGQGTFGEVKQGKQLSTGRSVALKKVTVYEVKDGLPITALREIKLLKLLHHPHIVPVLDMAYKPPTERGKAGEVYMVEPYMDHDLNGLLDNPSVVLPMSQIKLYMRELLEGMLYLHQSKIMHRDMKAANLLIDNFGQLQIADFGLARPFHDATGAWRARGWKSTHNYTEMVVTRWYRPPELLAGMRSYGPAIDMWGVGCILAEMLIRKPLFKGNSEIHQLELIAQLCGSPNDHNFPGWSALPGVKNATASGRPDPNPRVQGRHDFGRCPRKIRQHFTTVVDCGRECADLLDKLLVLDPAKRMTAAEALQHEWFWTKPYPADPSSLPTYLPSKEIDRGRREWKAASQQAAPPNAAPAFPPGARPPGPAPMGGAPTMIRPPGRPPIIVPPGTMPPPGLGPGGAPKGAYPPMPRLAAAPGTGGYGRGNDQGWYNPSAPRGTGAPGAPRPYP